jgi:hypothetical protein
MARVSGPPRNLEATWQGRVMAAVSTAMEIGVAIRQGTVVSDVFPGWHRHESHADANPFQPT